MMAFSFNFSVALAYAVEAAWHCERGELNAASSLLVDGWFLAGLCTAQARFKESKTTTAENLAFARSQRKDRSWKSDVFAWCDDNHQRFPLLRNKINRSALAQAALAANLVDVKFPAIYGWVCEWARTREQR